MATHRWGLLEIIIVLEGRKMVGCRVFDDSILISLWFDYSLAIVLNSESG